MKLSNVFYDCVRRCWRDDAKEMVYREERYAFDWEKRGYQRIFMGIIDLGALNICWLLDVFLLDKVIYKAYDFAFAARIGVDILILIIAWLFMNFLMKVILLKTYYTKIED